MALIPAERDQYGQYNDCYCCYTEYNKEGYGDGTPMSEQYHCSVSDQTKLRDWLGRAFPKRSILCRVGHKP